LKNKCILKRLIPYHISVKPQGRQRGKEGDKVGERGGNNLRKKK
jgi:hypothetical protein